MLSDMKHDVERYTDVHAQFEKNTLRYCYTVEKEVEIEELFVGGQLTLWRDEVGWDGYERRGGEYWRVNYRFDREDPVTETPATREAVVEAVKQHIADPDAGRAGEFKRGATPP